MWILKLLAHAAIFGTLTLCALVIVLNLFFETIALLYQIVKGRVFCRHCGKKFHISYLHDHTCIAVPVCQTCGTYLSPHIHTCPNKDCSEDVSEYLASIFLRQDPAPKKSAVKPLPDTDSTRKKVTVKLLSDADVQKLYPCTSDRMGK